MKKYTLIAEEFFSGVVPIKKGDEIKDLTGLQVSRFLKNGSAKFKTKKEHETYLTEYEDEEKIKLENEAKAKALLEKERLENDLINSITETVNKKAALDGVVLEESEVLEKVESLKKFLDK